MTQTTSQLKSKRQVLLYPGEDGYFVAEVPSLPGCVSQGKTRAEALANIEETISLYIEVLHDRGEPIPTEVEVVLPPFELLIRPRQVAAARSHAVGSRRSEVIEGEAMRFVELMIHFRQNLVRIIRTGYVALPFAACQVRQRDVILNNSHRHRIEPVSADKAADAVANKSRVSCGISRLRGRSGEVTDALQVSRHDGVVQKGAGGLAQA